MYHLENKSSPHRRVMTQRGNACAWPVIYVCEAEWMRSSAQCTGVSVFYYIPMFSAVPIKHPSKGFSYEQEAAPPSPLPQGLRV